MSDELEDLSTCEPRLITEQQHTLNQLEKLQEDIANKFLDEAISEIKTKSLMLQLRKLKNNKSAYSDKIRNEMLKSSAKILLKGYQKLLT